MKSAIQIACAVLFLCLTVGGFAQANPAATNAPVSSGGVVDLISSLSDIDVEGMADFFTNMQGHLEGTDILDLDSMKDTATRILPVLAQYEETEPYAIWLRAHLDDFDTAGELRREIKRTNAPVALTNNPARYYTFQRAVWVREIHLRPLPPLAQKYLPTLKKIFIEEGVPAELAWVAGVESSFDSRARSPAGAAGMFQLMPATARDEHLSLWPFDQRYWVEKSAHAAAHYLRVLHAHYHDWPLALAAYNVGMGRVDKLLREHKAGSFPAISRWLPAETQMYVPKLEATLLEREGRSLSDLKMPQVN